MKDAIYNFASQFSWEPKIENEDKLGKYNKFLVAGMGGSHLAADLLKIRRPDLDLIIHNDYGLPVIGEDNQKNRLIIAGSHSGNTEETIDAFKMALEKNMPAAALATGGKLLDMAAENSIPYVRMPEADIQPRLALGFSLKALLKIMGEEEISQEAEELAAWLNPAAYEEAGKLLAEKIKGYVPIIYSSAANAAVALNWKIKFNETGKIPSFYNVLPELNHNEMTGFDPVRSRARTLASAASNGASALSKRFYFIFLKDREDHPRIIRRMEVLEKLYCDRGLPVEVLEMSGKNVFQKIFSSLLLADWAAYYAARQYGMEPEQVPMVEEFKKMI